jgi:fibronectin type 3 domain-containing protein
MFNPRSLMLTLVGVGLLAIPASAAKVGGLAALPTPDGAMLRWYLPGQVIPKGGFTLHRSSTGAEETIQVASPQPKEIVLKNNWMSASQLEYLSNLYSSAPDTNNEKIGRAILELQMVTHPDWAKAFGILYTDTGLKPGQQYNYRVTAKVNGKETELGKASITTGATPKVPVPMGFKAEALPDKVRLFWTPPGGYVASYHIFRGEGSKPLELQKPDPYYPRSTTTAEGASLEGGALYTDRNLEPGKKYRYAIRAVDLFGRESIASEIVSIDPDSALPLSGLVINNSSVGDNRITIEWKKTLDTRVTSILVMRGLDPEKPLEIKAKLPATTTSYTDTDILGGTHYYYAIVTQSADGAKSQRGPLRDLRGINLTQPAIPNGLKITPKENALELNWSEAKENDLWGYLVLRAESDKTPLDKYVVLTDTPLESTKYSDPIPQGVQTKYLYRIIAINTSNVRSKASEAVRGAVLDKTAPEAPVLLSSSGLEGAIGIVWSAAATPDLETFEVYRADPSGQVVLVQKLNAKAIGYVDRTVIPNTSYTYVVVAVDTSGNRSSESNPLTARAFLSKAPSAPKALKATVTSAGVKLEWEADERLLYVVYRIINGKPVQVSEAFEGSSFTDKNGKPGSSYVVRAVNISGLQSPLSAIVTSK